MIHYLVTYEFIDDNGKNVVHEQDVNNRKFFNRLSIGDTVEILHQRDSIGDSYPTNQIRADRRIAQLVCLALILIWGIMAVILV